MRKSELPVIRRFVRLLSRPSTLITLAAASFLAADLVLIFVIGPIDFAFDFWCCYQQAGERAITDPSTLYVWSDTYTFRYTPLGALLFVPLVPLSAGCRCVGVDRHQAGGARRGRARGTRARGVGSIAGWCFSPS